MKRDETNTNVDINLTAKVRNILNYKNNNMYSDENYTIGTGLIPQ